jgi:threonine dehydratase
VNSPTLAEIAVARARIAGLAVSTPLVASPSLSARMGPETEVRLKLETLQPTGAFKLRGAANAVLGLAPAAAARGIVAASTGNHGRAVAYAARAGGHRCTVFLSSQVPANKVAAIRALGAEVVVAGESFLAADTAARACGGEYLPPFDDPRIIAGQGTLGLELAEQWPEVDHVLVPLSGGGLLAGVALAMKAAKPGLRVTGVCMRRGAAMLASLAVGRPVLVEEVPTLADCLAGDIGLDNRYTFPLVRALMDDAVELEEEEIAAGLRHLFSEEKIIAEGAGAVGVAALIAGKVRAPGCRIAVLVTGNNIDSDMLRAVLERTYEFHR